MAAYDPEKPEYLVLDAMNRAGLRPKHRFLVDNITVDFAFPELKIAVEFDGKHHHEAIHDPKQRDAYLKSMGWSVYRFSKERAFQSPKIIAGSIADFIKRSAKPAAAKITPPPVKTATPPKIVKKKVLPKAAAKKPQRKIITPQPTRRQPSEIGNLIIALAAMMVLAFILIILSYRI